MEDLREVTVELKRISDTMVRNTATLEVHVARTAIAEKRLDSIESFNRWFLGLFISGIMAIAVQLLFKS